LIDRSCHPNFSLAACHNKLFHIQHDGSAFKIWYLRLDDMEKNSWCSFGEQQLGFYCQPREPKVVFCKSMYVFVW